MVTTESQNETKNQHQCKTGDNIWFQRASSSWLPLISVKGTDNKMCCEIKAWCQICLNEARNSLNCLHSTPAYFSLEGMINSCAYLCQFHHHVGEDMEEANNSIPQPAVGQRLLVARAGALWGGTSCYTHNEEPVGAKVQFV